MCNSAAGWLSHSTRAVTALVRSAISLSLQPSIRAFQVCLWVRVLNKRSKTPMEDNAKCLSTSNGAALYLAVFWTLTWSFAVWVRVITLMKDDQGVKRQVIIIGTTFSFISSNANCVLIFLILCAAGLFEHISCSIWLFWVVYCLWRGKTMRPSLKIMISTCLY